MRLKIKYYFSLIISSLSWIKTDNIHFNNLKVLYYILLYLRKK